MYWHFPYYHPERGFEGSLKQIGIDDFAVSQIRPQSAVRRGDYKLLRFYEEERGELYRLRDDVGEQRELSDQVPAVARDWEQSLARYLDSVRARRPKPLEAKQ